MDILPVKSPGPVLDKDQAVQKVIVAKNNILFLVFLVGLFVVIAGSVGIFVFFSQTKKQIVRQKTSVIPTQTIPTPTKTPVAKTASPNECVSETVCGQQVNKKSAVKDSALACAKFSGCIWNGVNCQCPDFVEQPSPFLSKPPQNLGEIESSSKSGKMSQVQGVQTVKGLLEVLTKLILNQ